MLGIALGAASFFVVFWVDAVSLNGTMRRMKPFLWVSASGLFVAGVVLSAQDPQPVELPAGVAVVGGSLATLFFLLLIYSLFIEIPLVAASGAGSAPPVISRGTYALCRHPGVLWLAGFLVGAFLTTGSRILLIAIPVWVGLDAVYVVLQERLYFPRLFGGAYADYQRAVPMLLPTPRSLRECARTVFRKAP